MGALGAGVLDASCGAYTYLGSSSWVSLAADAPLHDPQTGARRQSDLAQAEPMPIVQIDAVHDNARVQRTVMQCHSRVGRVTNRA